MKELKLTELEVELLKGMLNHCLTKTNHFLFKNPQLIPMLEDLYLKCRNA